MMTHRSAELLECRRLEAIGVAERCAQILRELGASEIILFGSLRGDAPWHWQSDLDLAVSGISDEALCVAYEKLATVVPEWLKFDLVDLEQVAPPVRCRILQQDPMPTHPLLVLKLHIDDEMAALARLMEVVDSLLAQCDTIPDIALVPALASYITDFYTSCERISERVAVALDGGIPEGANWHELLLRQMADGRGNRPALWQGSLLLELNEFRKFRHIDRHRYQIELKRNRVLELAGQVRSSYGKILGAIEGFNEWLSRRSGE
jgi:predicted nucleotidyltransferase